MFTSVCKSSHKLFGALFVASINFRPTDEDQKVMDLISRQHPVTANTDAAIIRKALEVYWFEHAPGSGRSKSMRIDRLEKKMDLVLTHLGIEFIEAI
jgi:hypothetical protein